MGKFGIVLRRATHRAPKTVRYGRGEKIAAGGCVAAADSVIRGFYGILWFLAPAARSDTSALLAADFLYSRGDFNFLRPRRNFNFEFSDFGKCRVGSGSQVRTFLCRLAISD